MAYANLKKELIARRINQKEIADFLDMTQENISIKMNGRGSFSIAQAQQIQRRFFPELTIDYLFAPSEAAETQILNSGAYVPQDGGPQ